jgi:hypothetical protein
MADDPVKDPPKPETFSKEYVHDLREESKGNRLKAQEEAAARKAADDARDAEKAERAKDKAAADAKVKEAQTAADARVIRAELKAVAIAAGMVDLDGLKLADLSTVKLNKDGEVEGATELMEALKKSKPYLFGTQTTSSTTKAPPKEPPKGKLATEMTNEEYAAAKAAAIGRR